MRVPDNAWAMRVYASQLAQDLRQYRDVLEGRIVDARRGRRGCRNAFN